MQPRPTDIILKSPRGLARFALGQSLSQQLDVLHRDTPVLMWSLGDLDTFSLSPTILQALNRLRILAGLPPLRTRADGTIDLPDEPLQFAFRPEDSDDAPFVR